MEATELNRTSQEYAAQAGEKLKDLRTTLDQAMTTMTERTREAARYADRRVADNPWTSVGIAFSAGMIFGALLTLVVHSQQRQGLTRYLPERLSELTDRLR
jgi:ElaB/YqjD/DUF883 family membrane-anchored ribosome-binding protein